MHPESRLKLLGTAMELQPADAFRGTPAPPFGPGLDATIALDTAGQVRLEIHGAFAGGSAMAGEASKKASDAIRHIESKVAVTVKASRERKVADDTEANLELATAKHIAAVKEYEKAKTAYREGIRVRADAQLIADRDFAEAQAEDAASRRRAADDQHRAAIASVQKLETAHDRN